MEILGGKRLALAALAFPLLVFGQNYVFGPNVRLNDNPPGRWTAF
jgi:hypothetical protein